MPNLPTHAELREAIRRYSGESGNKGIVLSLQAWAVLLDMMEAQNGLLDELRAELAGIKQGKGGTRNG